MELVLIDIVQWKESMDEARKNLRERGKKANELDDDIRRGRRKQQRMTRKPWKISEAKRIVWLKNVSYCFSFFSRFLLFVDDDPDGIFRIDVPFPKQKKIELLFKVKQKWLDLILKERKKNGFHWSWYFIQEVKSL